MRILVDHSGYDLLNLGDAAMLQACTGRLRALWPDAEIRVVCHAPDRLAVYCPGTTALGPSLADRPLVHRLPKRIRLGSEQVYKMAGPLLPWPAAPGARNVASSAAGVRRAVREADVVVAAGGGYLTDTWWWHGVGVLNVLGMAQRLGRPTAMFGQGVGPLTHRLLRRRMAAVLPRLAVLGLREGLLGPQLLDRVGLPSPAGRARGGRDGAGPVVVVTGDDALGLACAGPTPAAGGLLGVNVRVSAYAGVDPELARSLRAVLWQAARARGTDLLALPVCRYPVDSDLRAVREALGPAPGGAAHLLGGDLRSPAELARAVRRCRAVVTGSYHAAVFALANGVPAVCLTGSPYYDGKFAGLAALFPGAVHTVPLVGPGSAEAVRAAVARAWATPAALRAATVRATAQQIERGHRAYEDFHEVVECRRGPAEQGAWPRGRAGSENRACAGVAR